MKTSKDRRLELDKELRAILQKTLGKVNIYYQPPESVKLMYPCIVYQKDTGDTKYADNGNYMFTQAYQITFITKNPDNDVIDEIRNHFKYCKWGRHFVYDNLNHEVVIIYY